jgi:TRAP-type C4-dicarboxylate transport system permease small subunit
MNKESQEKSGSRLLGLVNRVCLFAAVISMLFMAAVVVTNVVGRYFFHSPFPATMEIVGLAAAVLISLGLFPSQLAERNISVPIIIEKLGPRTLKVFTESSLALSLCIVAILIWTGAGFGWEMLLKHERTSVLLMPLGPFRLIWVLGCFLLFIILAIQLVRTFRRGGK